MLTRILTITLLAALMGCMTNRPTSEEIETTMVSFQNSGPPFCLDMCEHFRFHLFEDGNYIYIGEGSGVRRGVYRGQVDLDVVEQFREAFLSIHFFEFDDNYGQGLSTGADDAIFPNCPRYLTDQGEHVMTFRNEGRVKRIQLEWGCWDFEGSEELHDLVLKLQSLPIVERLKTRRRSSR